MRGLNVTHDAAKHRYEAEMDGKYAGYVEYDIQDDLIVFTHTEVDPEVESLGIASSLARHAMDDIRAQGTRKVLPSCPFIKNWIGKNPAYLPWVAGVVGGSRLERRNEEPSEW